MVVLDALFLDDHAARHLSCSVAKHHDGDRVLGRLAKESTNLRATHG